MLLSPKESVDWVVKGWIATESSRPWTDQIRWIYIGLILLIQQLLTSKAGDGLVGTMELQAKDHNHRVMKENQMIGSIIAFAACAEPATTPVSLIWFICFYAVIAGLTIRPKHQSDVERSEKLRLCCSKTMRRSKRRSMDVAHHSLFIFIKRCDELSDDRWTLHITVFLSNDATIDGRCTSQSFYQTMRRTKRRSMDVAHHDLFIYNDEELRAVVTVK